MTHQSFERALTFVGHAGHQIACLSYLSGTPERLPIVWVHGLTASLRFWEAAMYPELTRDRNWYSISLPLHHPSTYDGHVNLDALDENLFAELLARPLERLIPEGKFHLVGYSLGGFACLNYTAKFPDRVASVVSVGGFMTGRAKGLEGVLQFFSHGHWLRRAAFRGSWWVMQRHVIFLKLATIFYARRWRELLAYPALDPTLSNIFPDVRRHSVIGQRALFRYLLEMNLLDEVEDIDLPVLVIAGTKDPVIPYTHQEAYAKRLSQGRFVALEGVGHVAFAEAAEAFRRVLLEWFEEEPQS